MTPDPQQKNVPVDTAVLGHPWVFLFLGGCANPNRHTLPLQPTTVIIKVFSVVARFLIKYKYICLF